jgi:CDP-paratose 2-epimerase
MKVLITGGAGFIGCNAASRFIRRGAEVVVIDNLRRPGAARNLEWLRGQGSLVFESADVRDRQRLIEVFREHRDVSAVLHLSAQVAVTTSVADPGSDFEINTLGTFNVLEAMRQEGIDAALIYSSTNKVYGQMDDLETVESAGRYAYRDLPDGISERRPLDFHSPYGCSKGAADQYVLDYHRIYGLKTVVFRQSCIYGTRQFGLEDQGWVAWFMIATTSGQPLTIYGSGKQVRDVLFVDDLLDAFDKVVFNQRLACGKAYNMGGGPENTLSLLELLAYLEKRRGEPVKCSFTSPRPGDQLVFVSDTTRAQSDLDWKPRVSCAQGLDRLYDWIVDNSDLFSEAGATLQPPVAEVDDGASSGC